MSVLGAVGLGLQLVGSVGGSIAQNQMVAQQAAYSKQAENARQQQMQLEAQRQKRQAVRQALMARSMALSNGVNQGAQYGSGVQGGMGEAINTGAENQQGVNSSNILGARVFQANRNYYDATASGQAAMSMWSGISSLGGVIASNADTIGRLGQDWGNKSAPAGAGTANQMPPTTFGHGMNNGFRQPVNSSWAQPYYNYMNINNRAWSFV